MREEPFLFSAIGIGIGIGKVIGIGVVIDIGTIGIYRHYRFTFGSRF